MLRRLLLLLIPGLALTAVLASLGVWQMQRMDWKARQLAAIQAGIEQPAGPLPAAIDPAMRYLPVVVEGRTTGQEILVLSGTKELGDGYNVVSGFETADGRRIMVDRGFIPQDDRHAAFGLSDTVYGGVFYMATGFHGAHVIIGTIFLLVCLIRFMRGEMNDRQHVGFEAAAWYWHFVDVVWLFLFAAIYVWGR